MKSHLPENQAKRNAVVSNSKERIPPTQFNGFVDNRPIAAIQRQMQETANNYTRQKSFNPIQKSKPPVLPSNNKVIQAYRVVNPENVSRETEFNTQDIEKGDYSSAYKTETIKSEKNMLDFSYWDKTTKTKGAADKSEWIGLPSLKISENNALAINNTSAQPKEFFASPEKIEESNTKLERARSRIRLKVEAGSIKLPDVEQRLSKVVAAARTADPTIEDGLAKIDRFASHECNEVIKEVVGSTKRVVVLAEHNRPEVPQKEISTYMGGVPASAEMSDYLSENPDAVNIEAAVNHKNNFDWDNTDIDQSAIDYGNLSAEQRDAQSRALGLNEYAAPQVGEGYVINSQYTPDFINAVNSQLNTEEYLAAIQDLENIDKTQDVAHQERVVNENVLSMVDVWMVHYAGVVAKDGEDAITLENYNRGPEYEWQIRRIFNNLFKEFAAFRTYIREKGENLNLNNNVTQADQFITEVHILNNLAIAKGEEVSASYKTAIAEAYKTLKIGLKTEGEHLRSLIHFQMYGPGAQSFHSTFKGMTSNPITYRTRGSKKEELAGKIERKIPTYNGLINGTNITDGKGRTALNQLQVNMQTTLEEMAIEMRAVQNHDAAERLEGNFKNNPNLFCDPILLSKLINIYLKINSEKPRGAITTRDELITLIDGNLDSYYSKYVASQSYVDSLNALKTFIGTLPQRLDF